MYPAKVMGPLIVQINDTEIEVVESGETTGGTGKKIPLASGENVVVFVLDHPLQGSANIRIELSNDGHREGAAYYGHLPEFGTVDFDDHGETVSVCHQGNGKESI